jgi:hypothetical protein
MRLIPFFAAIALATGASVATPAAADTRLAAPQNAIGVAADQSTMNPTADQYRERRWRGDRWRGNRGWRGDGWRGGYRYRGNGWRYGNRWRGGVRCRTSWRYGRPHRVCWRR